jgi:hypothetical protein
MQTDTELRVQMTSLCRKDLHREGIALTEHTMPLLLPLLYHAS